MEITLIHSYKNYLEMLIFSEFQQLLLVSLLCSWPVSHNKQNKNKCSIIQQGKLIIKIIMVIILFIIIDNEILATYYIVKLSYDL